MLVTLTGPLLCLLAPRHTETPREERKLRTAQTTLYLEQKKKKREMVEENGTGDAGTFRGTARCVPESTRPAHRGGAGKRLSLPGGCRARVVRGPRGTAREHHAYQQRPPGDAVCCHSVAGLYQLIDATMVLKATARSSP